jgi:predicted O-linked N-acetylglucosamine transferase (SPINDLY family)
MIYRVNRSANLNRHFDQESSMIIPFPDSQVTESANADNSAVHDRLHEAVHFCLEHLKKDRNNYLSWLNLGNAVLAQQNPTLYLISHACYEKSLRLHPDNPEAYIQMSFALKLQGRQTEAIAALQKAQNLDQTSFRARFNMLDLLCPIIYFNEADIASSRAAYTKQLNELCEVFNPNDPEAIEKAAEAVGKYPFHLAYQGYNDCLLQWQYGNLVCRIQAAKYPQFSQPLPPPPQKPGEPLRVGIVSGFFCNHSNWKMRIKGWLEQIDKKRFSLHGYYTGSTYDDCTSTAKGYMNRWVEGPISFEKLCAEISADTLHVLIYPEIGMNRKAVRLSSLRLAPVQCTTWGHPTTSGLPTMDYFLSSDLMEPAGGESHYTESLIRLPNLGVYYSSPEIATAKMERSDFGLKEDTVIYLCLQSLSKYLPQYDEVFPRIAKKNGNCQFTFIGGMVSKPVVNVFRRRLADAFSRHGLNSDDFIVFLPSLDGKMYAGLNHLGDIFLDSIGWSGCNTTLEAIASNVPIVTFPGQPMRSRHSMAMLRVMGITETIAESVDDYVRIAASIGTDTKWRERMSARVEANKYKLYNDSASVRHLESFLEKALADYRRRWNK